MTVETFGMTDAEKAACIAEIYPRGPITKWADLSVADAESNARWWRKRHPQDDPVDPQTGLKRSQFDELATRIGETLTAYIPGLVRKEIEKTSYTAAEMGELVDAIAKSTREFVNEKIAEVQTKRVDASEVQTKDGEQAASFERRLSRHADHLSRLEDRMRKLEGKA